MPFFEKIQIFFSATFWGLIKDITEFSAPKALEAFLMERDDCYSVEGSRIIIYLCFLSDERKLTVERTEQRSLCTFNLKG